MRGEEETSAAFNPFTAPGRPLTLDPLRRRRVCADGRRCPYSPLPSNSTLLSPSLARRCLPPRAGPNSDRFLPLPAWLRMWRTDAVHGCRRFVRICVLVAVSSLSPREETFGSTVACSPWVGVGHKLRDRHLQSAVPACWGGRPS